MKKLLLLLTVLFSLSVVSGQLKPTDLDNSPLDISYLPHDYPKKRLSGQNVGEPLARVVYSRPQKRGRHIFGEEVKYNEVWRLGANESTEIEFFKNATVGGKRIPKGRYTMYCIPSLNKWTIIFNKDNYNWGSFMYRADRDLARIDVPLIRNSEPVEALTMYFENSGSNQLVIMWDQVRVNVPISF